MAMRGSGASLFLPDIGPSIALTQAMHIEAKHRALIHISRRRMRNAILAPFLALSFLLLSHASSWPEVTCKPLLAVKSVRDAHVFSIPITPRRWSATIITDLRFCAARSGSFEMDFVRIKENAPDLQFTERFRWSSEEFDVTMEMTPDEAIHEFRIGFIAPCVCREIDRLASTPRER
jgi:hypothetical protein